MDQHDPIWDDKQLLKKKRIIGIISVAVVFILVVALTILLRKPLLDFIRNKESFKTWMDGTGFWKYPLMVAITALQVVIALIPGEPIEIVAGYIFGTWGGLILCLMGTALGSVIIILLVRKLGMKFVTLFVTKEQITNLKIFQDPKKRDAGIFLLFLIPGTPKDILTYLAGLVPMHLGKYLMITSIARIPSVITSTMGGSMLGRQQYKYAIITFAITLVLTLLTMLVYRMVEARKKAQEDQLVALNESQTMDPPPANETVPEPLPELPDVIEAARDPETETADKKTEVAETSGQDQEEDSDVPKK